MSIKTFSGKSEIQIDLEYSSDVELKNSSDEDLTLSGGGSLLNLPNGVPYYEYTINEDLNVLSGIYGNWAQLDVGDYVIVDPEKQFVAGAEGDKAVVLMEGDRFYVVYPFDVRSNPAETRAISNKAHRLQIHSFDTGETTLREYSPQDAMQTGAVRVLMDSYYVIPSMKQLNEATVTIEKDSLPLNTLISSQAVQYDKTGIGCSLSLSLASIEMESLAYIFGVNLSESEKNNGESNLKRNRKKISLKEGAVNAGKLNPRKIIVSPEPKPSPTDDNYLQWLNSVIIFPAGVLADPSQELIYSPKQQRSYQLTIQCTPDDNGNRMIVGNQTL